MSFFIYTALILIGFFAFGTNFLSLAIAIPVTVFVVALLIHG